jgi:hypothetical protein
MRMGKALEDLRFVIGLFLGVIGLLVLVQHFASPAAPVEGISVNLLGGLMLTLTGGIMAAMALFDEGSK